MTGLNKQALLNLMAYPNEISDAELEDLNTVLQESPYFQLGHSLVAKAKHDKQTPDAHDALTHAAVYAPNRSLLRGLFYEDLKIDQPFSLSSSETVEENSSMEDLQHAGDGSNAEDETITHEPVANVPENYDPPSDNSNSEEEQVIESDEVYNELEENLKKLRESKNSFSEDEREDEDKKKITDESKEGFPEKKTNPEVAPILVDLVKDSEGENEPLVYGNSEQNELIDRFINSDWSGLLNANKKDSQEEEHQSDLSTDSVNISDDVITENLAEIYRRQGKKEKSIEIYHKLIWKFPQKKAYFAEIIQNLKAE